MLTQLRFQTEYNGIEIKKLKIDCYEFTFITPLSNEQTKRLMDFMGDASRMNTKSIPDFVKYFNSFGKLYMIRWRASDKKTLRYNLLSAIDVMLYRTGLKQRLDPKNKMQPIGGNIK